MLNILCFWPIYAVVERTKFLHDGQCDETRGFGHKDVSEPPPACNLNLFLGRGNGDAEVPSAPEGRRHCKGAIKLRRGPCCLLPRTYVNECFGPLSLGVLLAAQRPHPMGVPRKSAKN